MKLTRQGSSVDPDSIRSNIHNGLAEAFCLHGAGYCKACYAAVEGLVIPTARAIWSAAVGGRRTPKGKMEAFISAGEAVEVLCQEAMKQLKKGCSTE